MRGRYSGTRTIKVCGMSFHIRALRLFRWLSLSIVIGCMRLLFLLAVVLRMRCAVRMARCCLLGRQTNVDTLLVPKTMLPTQLPRLLRTMLDPSRLYGLSSMSYLFLCLRWCQAMSPTTRSRLVVLYYQDSGVVWACRYC